MCCVSSAGDRRRLETAWWALDRLHPQLADYTVGDGPGMKLPLLTGRLSGWGRLQHGQSCRTTIFGFAVGTSSRSCESARRPTSTLRSLLRARGTHFSHAITTKKRASRARATSFVESGPLFVVGSRYRDRLLPLPESRGYGLGHRD
jgi:hypothetical protein